MFDSPATIGGTGTYVTVVGWLFPHGTFSGEVGVHGCISDTWHALTAPPKTPPDIVAKLNAAANRAMTDPVLLERFKELSVSPGGGSPAEIDAFIKEETRRWGEVIHEAGIAPE